MIKITATEARANFNSLAKLLIETATSQKAVEFAQRVIAQIEEKGADWMAAHAVTLQLLSDHKTDFCPVADNRPYFLGQFQMALRQHG